MGGHDHHHKPYTVPDASIYKLENAPELMKVQARLAKQGLKDPWIRNEVWRFDRNHWSSFGTNFFKYFSRGWKIGIPLFVVTLAVEKALGIDYKHHGHDGEHGEHH